MIERLIEIGFIAAEIVGRQRGRVVVRALHPSRGWMYEKFVEDDVPALEAWAATAVQHLTNPNATGEQP